MDSNKVASWIQITATIGVLFGIVLVVIELQQAKAIARADTLSQFFAEVAQNARTQMGENPSVVLSKACLRPDEISEDELFVLDGYFSSRWALADRAYRLESVADFGAPWQTIARRSLKPVIRLEHGRKWISQTVSALNPELTEIVSQMLEETGSISCKQSLNEFGLG